MTDCEADMTSFTHFRTKLYLIVLILLLIIPSSKAYAKEEEFGTGLIEEKKDIYHVPSSSSSSGRKTPGKSGEVLPAKYDSREQEWFSGIKLKNQRSTGMCWAFATTTAAEISYAKETYETTGEALEMSPAHLAYFIHYRKPDPLGLTTYDQGIDVDPWTDGGFLTCAMHHLATWSGVGLEENTPFEELMQYKDAGYDVMDFSYDDRYAYDDCAILENTVFYRGETDVDFIKELVYEYGAAAISIDMSSSCFPERTRNGVSYYRPFSRGDNHAVTIIGWDDDYPKENFSSYNDETHEDGLQPDNDGAWIVQNSWGSDVHDGGYFYVSYESVRSSWADTVAYDMQDPSSYEFNYQYDGNTDFAYSNDDTWNVGIDTDQGSKAANIFQAQTCLKLKAIGLTEYTDGYIDYTAEVYKGLSDMNDPESGELLSSFRFSTDTGGCKTIELPEPVYIPEGEWFSVVITINSEHSAIGREEWYYGENAHIEPGQSFLYDPSSDRWQDLYEYNTCFRIKGFADKVYEVVFTYGDIYGGSDYYYVTYANEHDPVVLPADPVMEGWLFTGWDQALDNVTENMTVNAQWVMNLADRPVSLSWEKTIYNGKVQKPTIDVFDGLVLEEGVDYIAKWSNPASRNAGRYSITITGIGKCGGTVEADYQILKEYNPLWINAKTAIVKYSKLKKKAQILKVTKVISFLEKGKGQMTYTKKSGNKKIKIAKKTGKVTVGKGLKKGT